MEHMIRNVTLSFHGSIGRERERKKEKKHISRHVSDRGERDVGNGDFLIEREYMKSYTGKERSSTDRLYIDSKMWRERKRNVGPGRQTGRQICDAFRNR